MRDCSVIYRQVFPFRWIDLSKGGQYVQRHARTREHAHTERKIEKLRSGHYSESTFHCRKTSNTPASKGPEPTVRGSTAADIGPRFRYLLGPRSMRHTSSWIVAVARGSWQLLPLAPLAPRYLAMPVWLLYVTKLWETAKLIWHWLCYVTKLWETTKMCEGTIGSLWKKCTLTFRWANKSDGFNGRLWQKWRF